VVLFFKKGEPTKKIWYYQLKPGRSMGKTNPLNDKDLEEFIELQKKLKDSELSWSVDVSTVSKDTWDLSVKNPNGNDEVIHRSPREIIAEIETLDAENQAILERIKELL
jgi:type I restriction enzyme M protein